MRTEEEIKKKIKEYERFKYESEKLGFKKDVYLYEVKIMMLQWVINKELLL